jgi:acyl dehydratase
MPRPSHSSASSAAALQPQESTEVIALRERQLVTRELIRRFAVATGNMAPIHHDVEHARACGHRDLVAPPFYFCTLGLSLGRTLPREKLREDGLPLADQTVGRIVMGETSVHWYGHILAGDEVEVAQTFEGVETRRGRNGRLNFYSYTRAYTVLGTVIVREEFVRVGRE